MQWNCLVNKQAISLISNKFQTLVRHHCTQICRSVNQRYWGCSTNYRIIPEKKIYWLILQLTKTKSRLKSCSQCMMSSLRRGFKCCTFYSNIPLDNMKIRIISILKHKFKHIKQLAYQIVVWSLFQFPIIIRFPFMSYTRISCFNGINLAYC